jgi:methionine biosynthesis protein MetW
VTIYSKQHIAEFANTRWLSGKDQELVWRHRAALDLVEEEPVLDLGGGDGLFLSLLRERGFQNMKLLDVSPIAVRKAREKGLEAEVVDITEPLPFEDKSFGTVVALDVLEHLFDPLSLLMEMARVSRTIVVVVPNFQYWKERTRMLLGKVPLQCRPGHVYWFNYSVLEDMVKDAGLSIDSALFGGFLRLGPIGGWLAGLRPNLFAYAVAVRLVSKMDE